jgi:hypothetical protein
MKKFTLGRDGVIVFKTCQWISDGATTSDCSTPVMSEGKSYCEHHHWQVYEKGTSLRKRHKDLRVANAIWDTESQLNAAAEMTDDDGGVEELRF